MQLLEADTARKASEGLNRGGELETMHVINLCGSPGSRAARTGKGISKFTGGILEILSAGDGRGKRC